MKRITPYIIEKLILNKQSTSIDKSKLPPIDPQVESKIENYMNSKSPSNNSAKHMDKMEGYMKKGSDPKRLIATIKDDNKLINRWYAGVKLGWDAAILEFGKAVESRLGFTLNQLHQYIMACYKRISFNSPYKIKYEQYFDLYNLKYDARS